MIRQASQLARFDTPSARLVVPLDEATAEGGLLVAAFLITGSEQVPTITVTDDLGLLPSRWRLANDTRTLKGRSVFAVRIGGHAGIREVVADTANGLLATGTGVVLETGGLSAGVAIQQLADLLAGETA